MTVQAEEDRNFVFSPVVMEYELGLWELRPLAVYRNEIKEIRFEIE